jgi:myo-inositol-1(or 4)-monophosphatase
MMASDPLPLDLAAIEETAVSFATLGGAEIARALGGTLAVRYKNLAETGQPFRDPVSEVDERVEARIREEVRRAFPDHAVLGEEAGAEGDGRVVWAVDPIDGTTNFINGLPLFCASVGVLGDGVPIAGAIWCSTSHALRAGVYHARSGGALHFESEPIRPAPPPSVRRRLVGLAAPTPESAVDWDIRKTGSAALECAFVAAGLLEVARFEGLNAWDVAGGVALVRAAGGAAYERTEDGWRPFLGFGGDLATIRVWRRALVVAASEDAARRLIDQTTHLDPA